MLAAGRQRQFVRRCVALGFAAMLLMAAGCSSTRWAELRSRPLNPLAKQLDLNSRRGPTPTPRTLQTLRRNNIPLEEGDPIRLVSQLQDVAMQEPTADNVYAIAEVSYVAAKRLEAEGHIEQALDLFGTVIANSYFYLFDKTLHPERNAYDPRFRIACDLYNRSLENGLRFLNKQGALVPGTTHTFETDGQIIDIEIAGRGTWHERHFCELKFVSDYNVKELTNHYRNYGLGVPMIAVYKQCAAADPANEFYPPGMTYPVTAFLRVNHSFQESNSKQTRHHCVIEFHDPTVTSTIVVGDERAPLETDLTTPLAYALENPAFKQANVPLRGLRDAQQSVAVSGLYLLEPFDPDKIPVVMVHGFWSSLVTWMEMFNDLRGSPRIRDRYQFWFYLYPTGPPFWFSAAHLREELATARLRLDPEQKNPRLDQTVLIGHSMGGLIAELQTMDSGNEVWQLASDQPFSKLTCPPDVHDNLTRTFFFTPNPSVRRVITIASPHHGSNVANMATQWLGRKLINLPAQLVAARDLLLMNNVGYFKVDSLLSITTAVDALSPSSPIWNFFNSGRRASWVTYHNIYGNVSSKSVLGSNAKDSDGVVSTDSAKAPFAASEIEVNAEHTQVHRHPAAILEVRRILLEHLGMSQASLASHANVKSQPATIQRLPVATSAPATGAAVEPTTW